MNVVSLEVVTPDGRLYEGEVKKVNCPTSSGDITVLPNHTPLVSVLDAGVITLTTKDDQQQTFNVVSGVIEIQPKHIAIMIHE